VIIRRWQSVISKKKRGVNLEIKEEAEKRRRRSSNEDIRAKMGNYPHKGKDYRLKGASFYQGEEKLLQNLTIAKRGETHQQWSKLRKHFGNVRLVLGKKTQ